MLESLVFLPLNHAVELKNNHEESRLLPRALPRRCCTSRKWFAWNATVLLTSIIYLLARARSGAVGVGACWNAPIQGLGFDFSPGLPSLRRR